MLAGEQRCGRVEYEHAAGEALERAPSRPYCVARTERLFLDGDGHSLVGIAGVGSGDDDDPSGAGLPGRIDHPVDDPPAEQRVQMLR